MWNEQQSLIHTVVRLGFPSSFYPKRKYGYTVTAKQFIKPLNQLFSVITHDFFQYWLKHYLVKFIQENSNYRDKQKISISYVSWEIIESFSTLFILQMKTKDEKCQVTCLKSQNQGQKAKVNSAFLIPNPLTTTVLLH